MANGNGRGGRQRQTDKQYVEWYIDGSYSEDEQCVGGMRTGGGTVVEEQYVRQVVHRRHVYFDERFTSGTRTGGTIQTSDSPSDHRRHVH